VSSAPGKNSSARRPLHGGRLQQAADQFRIPLERWLDLSTGVSPKSWPVAEIPIDIWQRLPEYEDGLHVAACDYYGCEDLLPLAGSQQAIELLPHLLPKGSIAIPDPGYQEHRYHWQQAGHQLQFYDSCSLDAVIPVSDYILVINPNNPSGLHYPQQHMLDLLARQRERGGYLIIDEAFIDPQPAHSLASLAGQPGLIILRSMGKFFGLAGIRVGFLLAEPELLQRCANQLSPWHISHPSRFIATAALNDCLWQQQARTWQLQQSRALQKLLQQHGLETSASALFQTCFTTHAEDLYEALARRAILTRLLDDNSGLRFGLPADQLQLQQLADALETLKL